MPSVRPFDHLVSQFAEFLRLERNLADPTIRMRCWRVSKFLSSYFSEEDLKRISPGDLDAALICWTATGGYSRKTVSTMTGALRSFFGYGESQGWCKPGLAAAIMTPRVFANDGLPTGPGWEDVRRLLKNSERDSRAGIRDHAILMIFAVYAVRAGEVARLRLDDIDWTKETITFTRSKSHRRDCFPLTSAVAEDLIRYLQEARPFTPLREVFLTARAPIRPVTSGTLCAIVSRPMRQLGIELEHYGPHALRHACATRLINQGLSLKEIGDHLGHRHPDTTRIYTKVDLQHLREIARFDLGGVL